jgi:hypothetical protein
MGRVFFLLRPDWVMGYIANQMSGSVQTSELIKSLRAASDLINEQCVRKAPFTMILNPTGKRMLYFHVSRRGVVRDGEGVKLGRIKT